MKRNIHPKSVVVPLTGNPLWLSKYLKTQFIILSPSANSGQALFAQGDIFEIFS